MTKSEQIHEHMQYKTAISKMLQMIKPIFAKRLKLLRKGKGLKQKDLGLLAEVDPRAISHYESGHILPRRLVLLRLSKVLDVKNNYWLEGATMTKMEGLTRAENVHRRMSMIEFFSKRLRFLRLKKGVTHEGLAKLSGVKRRSISFYERGTQLPLPTNLAKIANALNVKKNYRLEEIK